MLAQQRYGRNFMVPRRFQPPKFDYHRPLPPEWGTDQVTTWRILLSAFEVND